MPFPIQRRRSNDVCALVAMSVRVLALILFVGGACTISLAAEAPRFVERDGRWAFLVDGEPYLILGGQVHNSSAWPSELLAVWKALVDLHANTVEAPVYWEQIERRRVDSTGTTLTRS